MVKTIFKSPKTTYNSFPILTFKKKIQTMKNSICLAIALILTTLLYSQVRISNYVSDGSNKEHFIRNFEDKSYLISLSQTNELQVFHLTGPENKTELSSQNFQGIFDNDEIMFYENFMLFEELGHIVEYDFVNDNILKTPLPDSYHIAYILFYKHRGGNFPLALSPENSNTGYDYIVYQIGGTVIDVDFSTHQLVNQRCLYFDGSQDSRDHILFDLNSGQHDTLVQNANFVQNVGVKDSVIYYLNRDGQLYALDERTEVHEIIDSVQIELGSINDILLDQEHFIIITNTSDSCTVHVYDHLSFSKQHELDFDFQNYFDHTFQINHGMFTCLSEYEDLLIINLETGEYEVRETKYGWSSNYEIVDGQYLINLGQEVVDFQLVHNIELIDLENFEVQILEGEYEVYNPKEVGFARFGDKVVGAHQFFDKSYPNLVTLDLNTNETFLNEALDSSTYGFHVDSQVVKFGENIILVADSFYHVKGQTIEPFYSAEDIQLVNQSSFQLYDDKISFVQDEPKAIMSYNGSQVKMEANLEIFQGEFFLNTIKAYAIFDTHVIFASTNGALYRYEKATEEIVGLDGVHDSFLSSPLYIHNDYVYYLNEGVVSRTDGYAPSEFIFDNYSNLLDVFGNGIDIFKDQLIMVTDFGLKRIENDGTVMDLGSVFEFNPIIGLSFDDTRQNVMIGDNNLKIHYDGTDVYEFQPAYGGDIFNRASTDDVFFFTESEDGIETNTFFKSESKLYSALPEEIQDEQIIDYFESSDEEFIMTRVGRIPNDELRIYKVNASFDEIELVGEFLDVGILLDASFTKFYNEGFLYSADLIFLLSRDNQLVLLEDIKGSRYNNEVVEKDGELYVLALDEEYGRQLYSTTLLSFRTNIVELDEVKKFIISPNPVNDVLSIVAEEQYADLQINVYDLRGTLLVSESSAWTLDVGNLNQGMYVVEILSDGYRESYKVVKM